jgi:hypothetical protein
LKCHHARASESLLRETPVSDVDALADWDASSSHFAATESLVQTPVSFIRLRLQDDWTTLAEEKALVFQSIFCGWRFP